MSEVRGDLAKDCYRKMQCLKRLSRILLFKSGVIESILKETLVSHYRACFGSVANGVRFVHQLVHYEMQLPLIGFYFCKQCRLNCALVFRFTFLSGDVYISKLSF